MCVIILLHHVHPDYPVVVAANRDEHLARPSSGPRVLVEEPRVVGGQDGVALGTWMGANREGFFAGVTNQRTLTPPQLGLRSRGQLVLDVLQEGSTEAAEKRLARIDGREYNPFNLVFGDARGLKLAYARPGQAELEIRDVPDGVHVLPNDRLDSPAFPKVARVLELVGAIDTRRLAFPDLAAALRRVLADHRKPPSDELPEPVAGSGFSPEVLRELAAICIHTPVYGTRSATVLALVPGRTAHYLYAPGPPCTHDLEDVGLLLQRD